MAHQVFNFSLFCANLSQCFVCRSAVINNIYLRAGKSVKQVYKGELMVVASAEWEQKCTLYNYYLNIFSWPFLLSFLGCYYGGPE